VASSGSTSSVSSGLKTIVSTESGGQRPVKRPWFYGYSNCHSMSSLA
jgi:hypothetical protein